MLALFDIDGTICDTQEVESDCFDRAIQQVTGRRLASLDWTTYEDPTSASIVRSVLEGDAEAASKAAAIEREFVRLLAAARPLFPGDFSPLPGAADFIRRLQEKNHYTVAIATGGFASEARFKLQACGLTLDDFPHATSSDTPRRRDILALAAARAGIDLTAAVYFGDAPWDVHASALLQLPMIGIGRRHERLRALRVPDVFRDYSDGDAILRALRRLLQNAPVPVS